MPDDDVTDLPPPPPVVAPPGPGYGRTEVLPEGELLTFPAHTGVPDLRVGDTLPLGTKAIGATNRSGFQALPPTLENYPPPNDDLVPCDGCGMIHYTRKGVASCVGHSALGLPCRSPATHESATSTCAKHGHEQVPGIKKARLRRVASASAAKSLAKVKIKPIGDPVDHLAELAAEALAIKDHFADVVAELRQIGSPTFRALDGDAETEELADFLNRRDGHGYRFTDDKGAEQLDARVALYERALDRAEKFLVDLVKLDFEGRRVRLEETRTVMVMDFLNFIIAALNIDVNDPATEAIIRAGAPILDGEAPLPIETTGEEVA